MASTIVELAACSAQMLISLSSSTVTAELASGRARMAVLMRMLMCTLLACIIHLHLSGEQKTAPPFGLNSTCLMQS